MPPRWSPGALTAAQVLRSGSWNWFTARNYCRKRCMDLVTAIHNTAIIHNTTATIHYTTATIHITTATIHITITSANSDNINSPPQPGFLRDS